MSTEQIDHALSMKLDALYEQMLLTPCQSKEELNQWIKTFFGIPLPDYTLDEDSTSNPMQFVWDVYETALTGKRDRTTFVVAASRNSCKCLKEGTLVATPQGPVEIQNLEPGDTVYDENGNPVKVTAVHDQGVQDCVEIYSTYNELVSTCTYEHKWLMQDGLQRRVKEFKENDEIASCHLWNRGPIKVERVEPVGQHQCWDITVDSPTSLYCLHNGAVTHNTLSVAILEVLLMLHFGRDIIHMAAILDQSLAAVGYINKFMRTPAIQKYSVTDNKRVKSLNKLPLTEVRGSETSALKVLVASKDSSNAQHASVLCYDELDLLEKRVLSESAMIGDPDRLGKPPIFIYLSSRKSASGPIQEKINQSADPKYGIALHKWSVADIMIPCPEDVYRPDLPEVSQWVHKESLEIKQEEEMKHLPPMHLDMYEEVKAYSGCVNCAAFLVCKGRSPRQKSQPSSILRDIPFVRTILRETGDPEQVKAQILNLKPESSGVVFNKFDKNIHCKNLPEAYKFAFGVEANVPFFTKQAFIRELAANGWRLTCGVDFGYTDPAAAVLIAYHRGLDKCIILHTEMSPGFSNLDWLMYVKSKIYDQFGFDLLCPDTADRSAPGVASKLGMPSRSKKPSKIETGVSWIRARLWSPARQTYSLIVIRDGTTDSIITAFEQWQYKKGPMGFMYGEFETDSMPTHSLDACRYGIDPYVMAGVVQSSARMGSMPGTLLNHEDAQKVLTTVEASLSTKENFQEAMSTYYQHNYGLQLGWSDAQKMDNSRDKDEQPLQRTGNFIYSF